MTRNKQPLGRRIAEAVSIVLLLPLILPLLVILLLLSTVHRAVLYLLVWLLWLPRGKDTVRVFGQPHMA
jgi:hypothetical protein